MNTQYDIIIAGSGLGGLVCANVLSKEGFKVCVLEKNAHVGGCLQSFNRGGVPIDTGIHYVGCLDEGQILHQYFKYLDIVGQLKLRRLDSDAYDVINIEGREYKHAMGHENFIETLSTQFPKEKENIRTIVQKFKEVGDLIAVDVLRNEHAFSRNGLPYFGLSAAQFIEDCTSDVNLQNAIAGSSVLGGGERENASLYVFAMITNSNIESAYRFVDGSQQVADLLVERIKANGGEVYTKSEVTCFVVENEQITGVEINGHETLTAKHFITDIHPARTLELLDKCKSVKKAYSSRIHSLRESSGFFSVSMVLKDNMFEYRNKNFYYYDENNSWINPDYNRHGAHKLLFCCAPPASGKYAKVAHILEPMYWHEVEKWAHTSVEKRGQEYAEFKQRKAEALIDYLDQRHPGLKNAVSAYYTSTPLSYRDYTGTHEGSAYGIIKDFKQPMVTLLPIKTRLPNLYFTGQNNNVHGMIGVMLTAMYTCAEFVETSYLAKKIGNA